MYQTFVNRCTLPAIPILHIRRIWAEVIHYCFFFIAEAFGLLQAWRRKSIPS